MGSSLDHLIANGYLYGFGYEPAMWSAVRASRVRYRTSAPGLAGVRLVASPYCAPGRTRPAPRFPRAPRGPLNHPAPITPRRTRVNRRQSQRHRQSASSAWPFPRAGAGRSPHRPAPTFLVYPGRNGWRARFPKKPLGWVMPRPVPARPATCARHAKVWCIPLTGSGRCAAPACRGARVML